MARPHTICGRHVPRLGDRRLSFVILAIVLVVFFSLLACSSSSIPSASTITDYADQRFPKIKESITEIIPFHRHTGHPPPHQENDSYKDSSWWSNWKWRMPFSSSLTHDDDRSLLPPLTPRPPIYCYHDTSDNKKLEKDVLAAQNVLLLTWRRAWWAQGFKPVILSQTEAMRNPLYEEIQRMTELKPEFKTDIMPWLAFENMGGGLLAESTLFPMAARWDAMLTFLRRAEYPALTTWEGIGKGLYAGQKNELTAALKGVIHSADIKAAKSFVDALPKDILTIDKSTTALANYNTQTLDKHYNRIATQLTSNKALAMTSLNQLITSHLHQTWQSVFHDGIAVLKPRPDHMTQMTSNAKGLADVLASCSKTPLTSSCPPNNLECKPCSATQDGSFLTVATPAKYQESDTIYTIGTVPHPYTFATLFTMQTQLTVSWIRRESERDPWLSVLTQDLLGPVGSARRVVRFKDAVAGENATARSLWLVAEHDMPEDLSWHFGFVLPTKAVPEKAQEDGDAAASKDDSKPKAVDVDKKRELGIMGVAHNIIKSQNPTEAGLRGAMEGWNLADTEAWKFAGAFLARSTVERAEWEKEESKYTGGAGANRE